MSQKTNENDKPQTIYNFGHCTETQRLHSKLQTLFQIQEPLT